MRKINIPILLFMSAVMMAWAGCASSPPIPAKPMPAAPFKAAPAAPEKMEELVVSQVEEKKIPEKLLTFSMRDADIREVMLSLSKTMGYNIVLE